MKKGVAFGALGDQGAQTVGHARQARQQRVSKLRGLGAVERSEIDAPLDAVLAPPLRPPRVERGARRAEQQQRQLGMVGDQVLDEVQAAVVRPVQVIEQRHDGCAHCSPCAQQLAGVEEGAVAQLACFAEQAAQFGMRGKVNPEQMSEYGSVVAGQSRGHGGQPLLAGLRWRVAVAQVSPTGEQAAQHAVGLVDVLLAGEGLQPQRACGLAFDPGMKFVDQA